jgi:hypothetical protein
MAVEICYIRTADDKNLIPPYLTIDPMNRRGDSTEGRYYISRVPVLGLGRGLTVFIWTQICNVSLF